MFTIAGNGRYCERYSGTSGLFDNLTKWDVPYMQRAGILPNEIPVQQGGAFDGGRIDPKSKEGVFGIFATGIDNNNKRPVKDVIGNLNEMRPSTLTM